MKKFQFTLDKLKNYREQTLDIEKNNLGIMRAELVTMENALLELYRLVEEKNREFAQILAAGTSPREIATMKRYISAKQQDIVLQKATIEKQKLSIERQVSVVLEKTKDVKTLQKLEETQYEEHRAREQKEEEQFIEEFVTNSDYRRG